MKLLCPRSDRFPKNVSNAVQCGLLCMTSHRKTPMLWTSDRASHINSKLYTGSFSHPVGVVGNSGSFHLLRGSISKIPELHSQDLEKQPVTQPNACHKPLL